MNRMDQSDAPASAARASRLRRILTLRVCACAGFACSQIIHAQSSVPAGTQTKPTARPASSAPAVPTPRRPASMVSMASAGVKPAAPGYSTRAFGMPSPEYLALPGTLNFNFAPEEPPLLDPFQPGVSFDQLGGLRGAGMGFNGTGTPSRPGVAFGSFGGGSLGGRSGNLTSLFQMNNSFNRGLPGGTNHAFGTNPAAVPSLDQVMRGNFSLPSNSTTGTFQPSYWDTFAPAGSSMGGAYGRSSGSAIFSTSNLGNGVFLSARTGFGSRSMAGGFGSNSTTGNATGQKHSGPSLGLKLSF
jgi:hypothetical protein